MCIRDRNEPDRAADDMPVGTTAPATVNLAFDPDAAKRNIVFVPVTIHDVPGRLVVSATVAPADDGDPAVVDVLLGLDATHDDDPNVLATPASETDEPLINYRDYNAVGYPRLEPPAAARGVYGYRAGYMLTGGPVMTVEALSLIHI